MRYYFQQCHVQSMLAAFPKVQHAQLSLQPSRIACSVDTCKSCRPINWGGSEQTNGIELIDMFMMD
jgi:hypothetical protein